VIYWLALAARKGDCCDCGSNSYKRLVHYWKTFNGLESVMITFINPKAHILPMGIYDENRFSFPTVKVSLRQFRYPLLGVIALLAIIAVRFFSGRAACSKTAFPFSIPESA
jgi:hypothetical protein